MKKTTFLKTFLVAVGLLMGTSVWADPIETIGSLSSGWWTDFSSTYTLDGYGKYHFQFTTTNANDGEGYKTWLLVATDGNDSHGGGGNEYFVWRGDSYAWGQGKNSNAYNATTNTAGDPTNLVCSNTYATANPAGAGIQAAMNGAAVDMVITRESNNIYATATVTPTNGDNEFTMSFSYLYGNATSANIGLFLTVQNAQVVLNTAEQTASWSTVWTTDFSSAPSGMTYSVTSGSTNLTNGYLHYVQGGGSGNRAINTAFTDSKFAVDTNWKMDFDWNCSSGNTNASNVAFATNNGTVFTMTWASYATTVVVADAGSTELTNTLPCLGYNKDACNSWSHVTIIGVKDDGIYLTITNGTTTYVNNVKVSSTFGYPSTFNGSLGRAASFMYIDNVNFQTPAVVGFVATPTSEITGTSGTSRKFTLSCLTDGVTIYYATSDLEKGAAGWNTYTGEVTTDATTIWAYAEDAGHNTSDKMNFATGAGTTINLADATVTHSNNGVYTIASDQSAILGTPTATIHYQIDGGSEQTSTNASVNVNIATDGTLTYWLTADGYGDTTPADETVYAPRAYAATTTIDFKTSNENSWSSHGDEVDVDGDTHTYYKYLDQSSNILGDGLLATTFLSGTIDQSWRIQRYYGGTAPYANTEYVALKSLSAGQIVQIECSSAPTIVSNLTVVPASTYTGTYTYTATTAGDVILSIGKGVVLKTIKLCETTVSATVGAKGYSTLTSDYSLNFTGKSIKAYIVKSTDGSALTLTQVNKVVKNTPLLLYSATNSDSQDIPVIADSEATDDLTGNKLVAGDGTAHTWVENTAEHYVLYTGGATPGFYQALNSNVAVGKAYLNLTGLSATARSFDLNLGDDVTGISEKVTVNSEKFATATYNLNGQRVAQPTKGLYIVNGKKVVIK